MPDIIIINGVRNLIDHIKNTSLPASAQKRYVILEEVTDKILMLLNEHGFTNINPGEIREDIKSRFIREYVDLIGSIGKECSSRTWWATDIASKNRFTSRLPQLLHQFITIVESAKLKEYDHLIVVNPPWVIFNSVIHALKELGFNVTCRGYNRDKIISVGINWLKRIPLIIYILINKIYQSYYVKIKLRNKLTKTVEKNIPYYVIKSFIYNHSFTRTGEYKDVFFGPLPDFLKEKGKNTLIYAVVLGNYKQCIENISKCRSQVIIPLEYLLSLSDVIKSICQLLFCNIRIRKNAQFFGYDVKDIINNELIQTANGIQYYHYLHYWSSKKLLSSILAEELLLTYENNPWEKMCIMAAREHSPETKVIGYQHTVVPQASVNMFISQHEEEMIPLPDQILTVGESPKNIMERYGDYKQGMIEPACGLRFEYLFNILPLQRSRTNTILLALEGICEVYKMVKYAFFELRESSYSVVIRPHPVLSLHKMRDDLPKELWSNTKFSLSNHNSLKQDIESSDIILYWGSTVALEALSMGKPLIHYDNGSVLSYDPLFECDHLKWKVSEKDSLSTTIQKIYDLSDDEFTSQQKKAKIYLNKYILPISDQCLNKFVAADL